jgi:hypothetical protein
VCGGGVADGTSLPDPGNVFAFLKIPGGGRVSICGRNARPGHFPPSLVRDVRAGDSGEEKTLTREGESLSSALESNTARPLDTLR